jgi:Flp pilus assembly protein TadG
VSKSATWRLSRFLGEERGASMVEFSVIAGFYLAIVGGLIDFTHGFY